MSKDNSTGKDKEFYNRGKKLFDQITRLKPVKPYFTAVQGIRDLFKVMKPDESGMLEIVNASFIADEPFIFGEVNAEWNARELRWYMSQSLNTNDIAPPVPAVWQQVASKKGRINSNYGWCVFSAENGYQFHKAIDSLVLNKESRQAVIIYIRPSMHEDSVIDGMRDFMCTYSTQLLIRDGQLNHIVNMRSNDAVYGYKGDYFWQNTVHDFALIRLQQTYPDLVKGNMYWNAGSLHIYPRHIGLVK